MWVCKKVYNINLFMHSDYIQISICKEESKLLAFPLFKGNHYTYFGKHSFRYHFLCVCVHRDQWFSTRSFYLPFPAQEIFVNTWRNFWLSQLEGATEILWVGARDDYKHHTMHGTAFPGSPAKTYIVQNVNSAKVEKLWCK